MTDGIIDEAGASRDSSQFSPLGGVVDAMGGPLGAWAHPGDTEAVATLSRTAGKAGFLALPQRILLLFIGDVVLLNLALLCAIALAPQLATFFNLDVSLRTVSEHVGWFVSLTAVWCVASMAGDVYNLRMAARRLAGPMRAARTVVITALAYFLLPYVSAPLTWTRLSWLLFAVFALGAIVAWRYCYATVFVGRHFRVSLLILGAGAAGRTLAQAIADYRQEYELIGFVDDDETKRGNTYLGVSVLGGCLDLLKLVERYQVQEIALAIKDTGHISGELFQAIVDCQARGVQITAMVNLYERLTGRMPVDHISHQFYALSPLNGTSGTPLYLIGQRLLDIAVALVGLIVLGLVTPVLAVLIRLDSPGPIFYRQKRAGQGGRPFWVTKLRTMTVDAEKDGRAVWANPNDPRVTRFGRFARRTRLDEVPQLWNILKGEMSLVGPRPERPEIEAELVRQLPFYRSRHMVKPGLTGWAQINYGYGNSIEDALTKMQYDLYYIKHRSFWLDLLIILRTIGVVLAGKGS